MFKEGLVCGKFEVLHKGHLALIDFARNRCDKLNILLCSNEKYELIPGRTRFQWLKETYKYDNKINVEYTDVDLPYTSESNRDVAEVWSNYFKKLYPELYVIFTSEKYGDYVAEYMKIEHIMFDEKRISKPISSTEIIKRPLSNWDFISDVAKPYFVKKIVLFGTESTGKSTFSEKLAKEFSTNCVLERSRDIMTNTDTCTYEDMFILAEMHSNDINKGIINSNKMIFVDTNIETIKVYSDFLFNKKPSFKNWIEQSNKADLYIFLSNDAPYVQDGTRLNLERRNRLNDMELEHLIKNNLNFEIVKGQNWDERYQKAIQIIKKFKENL